MSEVWNTLRLLDSKRRGEPTEEESKKAYRALMAAISSGLPAVEKSIESETRPQQLPSRRSNVA